LTAKLDRVTDELNLRPAVRGLLIDPADRVLLVKLRWERTGWEGWVLPGGGIDAGEEPKEALQRELLEETGLAEAFIGPVIFTRRHVTTAISPNYDGQEETVYLVPCRAFELAPAMSTSELQAEGVVDTRWFSVDDLRSSDDRFVPPNLGDIVDRALEHGGSLEPLVIDVQDRVNDGATDNGAERS